ncbi:MAG: M20 family metallopeptidase [Lachnospiraceae bacterium]|nr:M20 family metallopeptidase [Lachnospiraceae bacterium]
MNEQEAVQLLKNVMAIPSVNGQNDEGKVAEYLCEYFRIAGVSAKVDRLDETHANVTAVLEGETSGKPVIWNGHLDTVPYGSLQDWKTDPAEPVLEHGVLYGRGASDMKSGLCAMVYALCEFYRTGKKPENTILFIGTCDEEKSGLGAEFVCRQKLTAGCSRILISEPTGLKLGMAQKGCIWLELQIHGKTSHGAYPKQGCSAVEHAWHIAEKIKQYVETFSHGLLGDSTANITKITGGTAPNMIPETCTVLMDIRITPGLTERMVLNKAKQIISKEEQSCKGQLQAEILIKNNRRAIEIGTEAFLIKKIRKSMEQEGLRVESTGINFFTDASILARNLPEAEVLLFGPGDPVMAHKPNECVELEKYFKAIRVFMNMLLQNG